MAMAVQLEALEDARGGRDVVVWVLLCLDEGDVAGRCAPRPTLRVEQRCGSRRQRRDEAGGGGNSNSARSSGDIVEPGEACRFLKPAIAIWALNLLGEAGIARFSA